MYFKKMKNLSEKEIREELAQSGKEYEVLAFKKLRCLKTYLFSKKISVFEKSVFDFKAGKDYDLWCVAFKGSTEIQVFIPGADRSGGFTLDSSIFSDWKQASDVIETSCGGRSFVLIADYKKERMLVPLKSLYPDNLSVKVPHSVKFDYWRPEFVFDGEKWFFGVAFYQSDSDGIFSSKKRCWKAFFRIDTQSWLSQEYCSRSAGFLMVALSEHPVEMGNYRIQFFQDVLHFSFI